MIFGIGTDLCAADRMAAKLQKPAFVQRVFSPAEQALLNEVAAETADYAAEMDEAEQKRCERTLEAAGVESLELSEELREQMREAAGPVVEAALRSQYGDDKMDRILSVLTP